MDLQCDSTSKINSWETGPKVFSRSRKVMVRGGPYWSPYMLFLRNSMHFHENALFLTSQIGVVVQLLYSKALVVSPMDYG